MQASSSADQFDTNEYYRSAIKAGVSGFQYVNLAAAAQYDMVFKTTLRYARSEKRALDWGSGSGHFSYFLLEQGLRTTAYAFDKSPSFLVGRPGYRFVQGTVQEPRKLPFSDASFDYVFSIGVLEHVHETGGDHLASLVEIRRILAPDGLFLCFHLPNKYGWIEPVKRMLVANCHFHTKKFGTKEIRTMLRNTGFDLLELRRYNFLPHNELSRVLGSATDRQGVVSALSHLDKTLAAIMPIFTQNYLFVARRKSPPEVA